MIAGVCVGEAIGVGKDEKLIPVELGIENPLPAAIQFVAQEPKGRTTVEIREVIVGQHDPKRSIKVGKPRRRRFLGERQAEGNPNPAIGHRVPDQPKPPRVEVRAGDPHQTTHLVRGSDAEWRKTVVDLEAKDRVKQAAAEAGVGHSRPIAGGRQKDLQFDPLIERQMCEGVCGLHTAQELRLSPCLDPR